MPLKKTLHRRTGIDAAHVFHLCSGDRLSIRDDREGFERRGRQAHGPFLLQLLEITGEFRACPNLKAASDFPDFEGAVLLAVFRVQFVDEVLGLTLVAIGNDLRDFGCGKRLGGGENQRFDDAALFAGFHSTHDGLGSFGVSWMDKDPGRFGGAGGRRSVLRERLFIKRALHRIRDALTPLGIFRIEHRPANANRAFRGSSFRESLVNPQSR